MSLIFVSVLHGKGELTILFRCSWLLLQFATANQRSGIFRSCSFLLFWKKNSENQGRKKIIWYALLSSGRTGK